MDMKLWTISGAPSPWRVALALAFKGLSYDTKLLSGAKQEHKSNPYLHLNPRGTVPTLESDDLRLNQSIAILAWLDREHPSTPLFGDTPTEAGHIWQTTMDIVDYLPPATSKVLSPIFFENVTEANDVLHSAAKGLRSELEHLVVLLSQHAFLSGQRPGAADAVAFPHVRLLQRAMDTKPDIMKTLGLPDLPSISPVLAAWVVAIEALPSVAETFPPHWTE
jgi:glutathione S-transferase